MLPASEQVKHSIQIQQNYRVHVRVFAFRRGAERSKAREQYHFVTGHFSPFLVNTTMSVHNNYFIVWVKFPDGNECFFVAKDIWDISREDFYLSHCFSVLSRTRRSTQSHILRSGWKAGLSFSIQQTCDD